MYDFDGYGIKVCVIMSIGKYVILMVIIWLWWACFVKFWFQKFWSYSSYIRRCDIKFLYHNHQNDNHNHQFWFCKSFTDIKFENLGYGRCDYECCYFLVNMWMLSLLENNENKNIINW